MKATHQIPHGGMPCKAGARSRAMRPLNLLSDSRCETQGMSTVFRWSVTG